MEEKYTSLFGVTEEEAKADMPAPRGVRHPRLMTGLVWARYLLPPLAALTLLVIGFFYTVKGVVLGQGYEVSLWRMLGNTFGGAHNYLGSDNLSARADSLYTALVLVALLLILLYLVGLFLSGLAAFTALRAFRAGHTAPLSNRMKVIFKVAFPNRVCLFIANLLLLAPTLYPHFYTAISHSYSLVGMQSVFFVTLNRPLIIAGALLFITLVLAVLTRRYEKEENMEMFEVFYPDKEGESEAEEK